MKATYYFEFLINKENKEYVAFVKSTSYNNIIKSKECKNLIEVFRFYLQSKRYFGNDLKEVEIPLELED